VTILLYSPSFSIALALLGTGLIWLSGVWLSDLLREPRSGRTYLSTTLFLGFTALGLVVSNLNYLGVSLQAGAPTVAVLFSLLSAGFWLRRRRRGADFIAVDWPAMAITGLAILVFVLPYLRTGGFPFFGDSFPYISGADYLQTHGYHDAVTDGNVELWKNGFLQLFHSHVRMGIPYMIGIFSGVFGLPGFEVYVGLSIVIFWLALQAFHNLTIALLDSVVAQRIALAIYSFNLIVVHWSAACGFLPQVIGVGVSCMLIASIIRMVGTEEGSRQQWYKAGVFLTALIWSYPEILPFAIAPLGATVAWLLWRGQIVAPLELGKQFGKMVGLALVINPYNSYWMVLGFLASLAGRPQSSIGLQWREYVTIMAGLADGKAVPLAILFLVVTAYGLLRSKGNLRVLAMAVLAICGPVIVYMGFKDSDYSFFKSLMYSYYILPLLMAAGVTKLPKPVQLGIGLVWIGVTAYSHYDYARGVYRIRGTPSYFHPADNAKYLENFAPLRFAPSLVSPAQRTLLFVPEHLPATWVSYFFRGPLQPVFPGVYFGHVFEKPAPADMPVGAILAETHRTGLLREEDVLYRNGRFVLTKVQPTVVISEEGFYGTEMVEGQPLHWMQDKGILLAYSPAPASVRLSTFVRTGPGVDRRQLRVVIGGQTLATGAVTAGRSRLETSAFTIPAGVSRVELLTDSETAPGPVDTRRLNLCFERLLLRPATGVGVDTVVSPGGVLVTEGLTADKWLMPEGATIRAEPGVAIGTSLQLSVEVPGVPGHLPVQLQLTPDLGAPQTVTITQSGRYDHTVVLKNPNARSIRLVPNKFFVPKDLGTSTDTRKLSIRILRALAKPI
jgi:hypothetical protein